MIFSYTETVGTAAKIFDLNDLLLKIQTLQKQYQFLKYDKLEWAYMNVDTVALGYLPEEIEKTQRALQAAREKFNDRLAEPLPVVPQHARPVAIYAELAAAM